VNSLLDEAAGESELNGRPVIGICAHIGKMNVSVFVPAIFVDRVIAAGCVPVLLPPTAGIGQASTFLDGLLLLPGPDVDPALYSAERHPQTRIDVGRDAAELELLAAAVDSGLPFLGVCRGLQLLNTLQCGTLHQHLPEIVGHEEHSPGDTVFGAQPTRFEPGSLAAAIFGDSAVVPCHHHQAIDRVGTGLSVTGRSEDGTIEAIELADHPFAVALQWHAEQGEDLSPFQALAEAAQHHRNRRLSYSM
jgi:putative glutamine amidotransferase